MTRRSDKSLIIFSDTTLFPLFIASSAIALPSYSGLIISQTVDPFSLTQLISPRPNPHPALNFSFFSFIVFSNVLSLASLHLISVYPLSLPSSCRLECHLRCYLNSQHTLTSSFNHSILVYPSISPPSHSNNTRLQTLSSLVLDLTHTRPFLALISRTTCFHFSFPKALSFLFNPSFPFSPSYSSHLSHPGLSTFHSFFDPHLSSINAMNSTCSRFALFYSL